MGRDEVAFLYLLSGASYHFRLSQNFYIIFKRLPKNNTFIPKIRSNMWSLRGTRFLPAQVLHMESTELKAQG